MLLSAIQIANPYPNERIDISFNELNPQLSNARFGVRFRYFYYDTWEGKINFRKTNDYTLIGNNTVGTVLSATSPTNFLNPNDLAPFRWNVKSDREYLYLTLLGGLSALTIWPSHPMPKMTKNSNFSMSLDIGVVSASAFNGEVQTPDFRKLVKKTNFSTVDFSDSNIDTLSGYATLAGGRKNYEYSRNINYYRVFNSSSLSPDLIANSLRIDIPVITSTNIAVDVPDQIFILSFYNDYFTNDNFNYISNNFVTNLSCLESEVLTEMGITTPYTVQASMNDKSGGVLIELKPPLYIKPNSDITVWYETSSPIAPGGVLFQKTATNNFSLSVNQGVYPNSPVYLFNYNFVSPTKDLFTVTFAPSSFVTSQTISSTTVETVMVDNYYQNSYDMPTTSNILFKRFIETSGDNSLLAYRASAPATTYVSEQWFPANSNQQIVFKNNGSGNKHKVRIQLQTAAGAIFEEENQIQFLLNKDKVVFNLFLTSSTDSTAIVEANIFPTPSNEYRVKWDANPPDNIIFRDKNDNVLERNTFYPLHVYSKVSNLGIDKTEIVLYSEEYDLSANTFWFPPSSVFGSAYLEIKGDTNDYNSTNYSTLSAFVNRNGYSYRVPTNANIIWNETANDNRGSVVLYTKDNLKTIKESTIYSSSNNYSLINATFSTIPVESDPKQVLFNISCNLFRDDFNFNATKMFSFRQYPLKQYLFIDAKKESDSNVYRSDEYTNIFYSTSGTILLSAIYANLNVNSADVKWDYKYSNGTVGNATGSSLNITLNTASACVYLSAFNATPVDGDFKAYNFTDYMCFYLLSSIQPFSYIGIPSNIYVPIYQQEIGDRDGNTTALSFQNNSYLNSLGMSAYKPCHTENFQFSATPGFDRYVWKIGSKIYETNSSFAVIPVTYNDVSSNNKVSVSAYNSIFIESNPVSIYNSASSDNSSVFREDVQFYDFPSPDVFITLSNNYFNVNKYAETPELNCTINTSYTTLVNYNVNLVLSSANFFQTKSLNGNQSLFSKLLKINIENSDFIINENSVNHCKVFLSGNIGINIPGYDYCTQNVPLFSNIVDLIAYNGPNLYLYTGKNLLSTGETATFYNGSNTNFSSLPFSGFSSFVFDNGEGSLQSSLSEFLTTSYSSEGNKSPSLTGILNDGSTTVQTWHNMIYVKNSFEKYDPSIQREFYDEIILPYNLEETRINPNDWQFADKINQCLTKFQTNMEYLSASCSINNINFPKANAGFLGSLFGNFKWHTIYSPDNIQDIYFKNLKSAQIIEDKLLTVNENYIQIYSIDETPELLYSFNRLGDGEVLEEPITIRYNSNEKRLFILDRGKNTFFVCEFDINVPQNIKLTHYWGGVGERTDRTKLNSPTDFCVDKDEQLYIVDKDSYIIKVYNKNLNWLNNIQLDNFSANNRPISISEKDGIFIVLTEDNYITVFDKNEKIINSFFVPECNNAVLNQIYDGIVYAISNNTLFKYSLNGTKISSKTFFDPIIEVFFDYTNLYVLTPQYIYRYIDFTEIDKIIDEDEDKAGFQWNNIFVSEKEFVTAYIYNDSFQKIYDNANLLNSRIFKKLYINIDEKGDVIYQSTSSVSPSALTNRPILLGTNEPVLYDTINRSIENLYNSIVELKDNINYLSIYPNHNNNLQWSWKYHYIDSIQRPSLNKNPISWKELRSNQITGSTQLSGISSWCVLRGGVPGNHSLICWNFQQTQCNSLFPLTWEELECGNCRYPFSWSDLENNCCKTPDFVFEDCVSLC